MTDPAPKGELIRLKKAEGPEVEHHRSIAMMAVTPASKETIRYLQDLCYTLHYRDFRTEMSVGDFELARALAFSDVFENCDDEARQEFLVKPIDYYRELPGYLRMVEHFRKVEPEESLEEAQAWIEKYKGDIRREIRRALQGGLSGDEKGWKLLTELLAVDIPKKSRNLNLGSRVTVSDKDLALLDKGMKEPGTDTEAPES